MIVGLIVAGFFAMRRPAKVAMARYAPASALGFLEINSLGDLVDGLTSTKAWTELAPVLGLSSQLKQVGLVTDLMGRTGLGPDEAVLAGRAQCAVVITGIESRTGETEESAYIHLKPDFALIIETHAKPETAARLAHDRARFIAERIFGNATAESPEIHNGAELLIFRGPEPKSRLVVSSVGSVVLVGNQTEAVKSCLDVIAGRSASMSDDPTLNTNRAEVDAGAAVFAYLTPAGINKLLEMSPLLIANSQADAETLGSFSDLLTHLSQQTFDGILYSSRFDSGVTEKYLIALHPQVAGALIEPLKPASGAAFEALALAPRSVESLALLRVEGAGELPERVLRHLSPHFDVVAGVALREFVISFRKQYGLDPSDSIAGAVGDEIAVVNFADDQPRALIIRVKDKPRVLPLVSKYLERKGSAVANEKSEGVDIMFSLGDDRRAAAFAGDYLILGTRDQISKLIETNTKRDGIDGDPRLRQILMTTPATSPILTYRPRASQAAKLMLGISKLMRVTDGSGELLERDSAKGALDRLPPSTSFTEFRSSGILIQTHSAAGNFGSLGSLIGSE